MAPVKETMPYSFIVSISTSEPPANSAGSASGRMTCTTTRPARAPSEAATSSWPESICENAVSSGRITNGVK